MRQYELAIRIAQIHHLIDERKYKKALAVVQTLDMKQVKSISDLNAIAEVYARTAQYDNAKDIYIKIYNKSHTRRCLYRLICLEIRTGDIEEAKSYYQEFLKMNANARDAIVLRYRIDKASGVSIGRLIDTLKELKVYEYIEEWAYELAKLYYKAGRFEECKVECQDIILWFGHGEIVERSKKLIEYVDDKETMAYLDDKDFTLLDNERPNPDDTGSLPNLKEYLEPRQRHEVLSYNESITEEKIVKAEDKKNKIKDSDDFIDDYEEDDFEVDADIGRIAKEGLQKLSGLLKKGGKKESAEQLEPAIREKRVMSESETEGTVAYSEISDEEAFDKEVFGKELIDENLSDIVHTKEKPLAKEKTPTKEIKFDVQMEKDVTKAIQIENPQTERPEHTGIANTADIKDNNLKADIKVKIPVIINKTVERERPVYSQSGTGITQDLSREISAIYEAEQKEQLKEKSVKVVEHKKKAPKDTKDASSIISRMTDAVKKDESKNITPAGIEEIEAVPRAKTLSRIDGIKPIEQTIQQVKEQQKQIIQNTVDVKPEHKIQEEEKQEVKQEQIDISVIEENVSQEKQQIPQDIGQEIPLEKESKQEEVLYEKVDQEVVQQTEEMPAEKAKQAMPQKTEEIEKEVLEKAEEVQIEQIEQELPQKIEETQTEEIEGEVLKNVEAAQIEQVEQELPQKIEEVQAEKVEQEEPQKTEEVSVEKAEQIEAQQTEEVSAQNAVQVVSHGTDKIQSSLEAQKIPQDDLVNNDILESLLEADLAEIEAKRAQEEALAKAQEAQAKAEEAQRKRIEAERKREEAQKKQTGQKEEAQAAVTQEEKQQIDKAEKEAIMRGNENVELNEKELPTTRALHRSFDDVLTLIGGELEPSHFVFVGNSSELIVGLSKRIVKLMKDRGYLSIGRIAKINAKQLNSMNINEFKNQLKGNCLLIDEAAELMVPTIASVFVIMEEFYGDFVVILSDEGKTLDQLFRFAPALARRFKYIIDISAYTENDL